MTLVKLHQLYENNIVLKKDLATDELINSVDQLEQCYMIITLQWMQEFIMIPTVKLSY